MINHFIHPIRFYTALTFFEENGMPKTNGMNKMSVYHSGLIHKLLEKLTDRLYTKNRNNVNQVSYK